MKRTLPKIIKVIAFLGIFYILYSCVSNILIPKNEDYRTSFARTNSFYALPEDSIDVLFLGASTFFRGITPLEMWGDYGFTGYVRAVGGQAPVISYYYLVESLKYQKPDVIVIDASSPLFDDFDVDEKEGRVRNAIDPLKPSLEKFKLIQDVVSMGDQQTAASYLIPLLRYHSRWNELERIDFEYNARNTIDPYKGYYGFYFGAEAIEFPDDYMQADSTTTEFSKIALDYYKKMLKLCQESNINVILITMPRIDWDYSRHLKTQQLADTYEANYLDYCLIDNLNQLDLDENIDFRDSKHLNTLGAQKVSRHLGALLQQTYGLEDKRNDPAYQQWHVDLQIYKDDYAEAIPQIE